MAKHNPLNWPVVGDQVIAQIGCEHVTRTVVDVDIYDNVIYQDSRFVADKKCSFGAWQKWCRDKKARIIKEEKGKKE